MKDSAWERAFDEGLKKFSASSDKVREQAILILLQLGASLGDLEWNGAGDLIHKPTGFGYQFKTETGPGWIQYIAEPVIKR